ncbi:hypothetical protein IWW37_005822 [Coemansia sp. RSA 2050]|nr:hypothetical protein IWW37_005822 [Coemansia sp. RSA 2050]KAJ2728790.1 hypothetical protein IW152_005861 [Coemansia sp. BCRC 34962]
MDYINRATGATKEHVGKALGREELEAKGHAQKAQAIGEQQIKSDEHAAEQGKYGMKQAGEKVKELGGQAQERVGEACGSQQAANKGRMNQDKAAAEGAIYGQEKDLHGNLK